MILDGLPIKKIVSCYRDPQFQVGETCLYIRYISVKKIINLAELGHTCLKTIV